jgi:hypothetical protein
MIFITTVLLCSCSKPSSVAGNVVSWATQVSFASNVETIVNDINGIEKQYASKDIRSLPTLCTVLGQDAQNFYTNALPSPSTQINQVLSKGLERTYKGSFACYKDGVNKKISDLSKDVLLLKNSLKYFSTAQELVASYQAKLG